MSIDIKNISFSYGEKQIFKDFSLHTNDGECVAIVGHNGAGKSTLLKMIVGILKPDSGEILLNNNLLWEKHRFKKDKLIKNHASLVGYVMQRPEMQLFADTVANDIAFGPKNLKYSEDKIEGLVEEWMKFFKIQELAEKSPFKISGGQQRLVAIAGVMAMDTPNICFDEPTSSLDDEHSRILRNLIIELKAKNKSIVLVSHDKQEVEEVADRIIHL